MAAGSGVPRPGAGVRVADRDGPLGLRVGGLDAVAAGFDLWFPNESYRVQMLYLFFR